MAQSARLDGSKIELITNFAVDVGGVAAQLRAMSRMVMPSSAREELVDWCGVTVAGTVALAINTPSLRKASMVTCTVPPMSSARGVFG
jgi:hypothetical protein